jgi:hypothetical protein
LPLFSPTYISNWSVTCSARATSDSDRISKDVIESRTRGPRGQGETTIVGPKQAGEIWEVKKKRQQIQSKQNRDDRRKNPAMVVVGEGASGNVDLRAAPPGADGGTKYRSQRPDYQE